MKDISCIKTTHYLTDPIVFSESAGFPNPNKHILFFNIPQSYFLSRGNFLNAYTGTILRLIDGSCHSHLQTVFNISEEEKKTAMSSMERESSQFGSDRIQWKLKQLKCIFSVLKNRRSSTSEQMALLIEAANELGKYHAYTLWSSIKFYQLCSSKFQRYYCRQCKN